MKKVVIGQAGGPTAVFNASLASLVNALSNREYELFFVRDGYEGLVEGEWLHGNEELLAQIDLHRTVPGSCLGSGRFPLKESHLKKAVQRMYEEGIEALIFIGGNGTMEALSKIGQLAKAKGYPLQIIGLPKTVDNDLGGTDHAPGFGSAVRYVARTTQAMSRDLASMKNFEQVRILETMGRNAGWLAASAGLVCTNEADQPCYVGLPELPGSKEELLTSIQEALTLKGYALVVVSEGFRLEGSRQVENELVNGRPVLGGISEHLAQIVKQTFAVHVRAELLGMNQRCDLTSVSDLDYQEAIQLGVEGANLLNLGKSEVMAAIKRHRTNPYEATVISVPLEEVAACGERLMPDEFLRDPLSYYNWLKPLVGELSPFPDPLPMDQTMNK